MQSKCQATRTRYTERIPCTTSTRGSTAFAFSKSLCVRSFHLGLHFDLANGFLPRHEVRACKLCVCAFCRFSICANSVRNHMFAPKITAMPWTRMANGDTPNGKMCGRRRKTVRRNAICHSVRCFACQPTTTDNYFLKKLQTNYSIAFSFRFGWKWHLNMRPTQLGRLICTTQVARTQYSRWFSQLVFVAEHSIGIGRLASPLINLFETTLAPRRIAFCGCIRLWNRERPTILGSREM